MYNYSTFYWDKQQEELQIKWRKEREVGVSSPSDDRRKNAEKEKIKNKN